MRQTEINKFEQFCKECTYERNNKRYTAKTAFSQAYANGSMTLLMARDYYEMIHPWLVIRYAFDWSKDRYNDLGFWKDINHKWEEFCIKHKIACIDEFNTMTIDELKSVTRELFGGNQTYGNSPADAMDYYRIYLDERDERIKQEKEKEEARIRAEKAKHEENKRKHEEELRKKNETKKVEPINPVYTQSVIVDDDDEDDDYIILNSSYKGSRAMSKGEVRIECESNKRITFSKEDSEEIIKSGLEYICLKLDRASGACYLRICNDSERGVRFTFNSSSIKQVRVNSKILAEYLHDKFGFKDKSTFTISGNESVSSGVISYRIIRAKK